MATPQTSDLSALQHFLNEAQIDQGQQGPVVVDSTNDETAGMSFAQLFSHYLAPEVAKLPGFLTPAPEESAPLPFAFGDASLSLDTASTSNSQVFDPSTFMPTIPGSPIGAFSPSTASTGRSPMSFPDLDFLGTSNDAFAIDPSIFNPPPSASTFSSIGDSMSPLDAPLPFDLGMSALPPLPSFPASQPFESAGLESFDFFAAPAPPPPAPTASTSAAAMPTTQSGRPKRNVATMVIEEEDEEELYSSDGSAASAATTRKSSRTKKPAAKKARAASIGASSASGSQAGGNGGVKEKKLPKTSVVPLASETLHRTTAKSSLPPVPQWADKPDPEEYSKLSSKEKRQLRNKLSARNFRHRRKEYITDLEGEISTRDTLISDLRDEVGVIRAENTGLRSEVATLKEKWQDLLDKLSSMTTPAPVGAPATAAAGLGVNPSRALSAGVSAASIKQEDGILPDDSSLASTSRQRLGARSSSSQIQLPNFSKDVSARAGQSSWMGGAGAGFMPVHTTFLPDVGAQLAQGLNPKPAVAASPSMFASNQSFNPAINALQASGQLDHLSSFTSHLRSSAAPSASSAAPSAPGQPKGTFEDFFASNPYWLRPDELDKSRAALYGKLANNAAGIVAAQKQQHQQHSTQADEYLPLPNGFRPAFFRASSGKPSPYSSSTTSSELLAFQSPSSAASLSSLPSLPMSHQDALAARQHATMAAVAGLAQQTLLQRMGNAFWDAFSGVSATGSSAGGKGGKMLDGEKVKAVMSGQARLEVVPVAPVASKAGVDELGAALGALSINRSRSTTAMGEQPCAFDEVCKVWTAPAVKEEA